ncbi:MAG: FmdB family transcriptional regulator [Thermoleophilia bacterium]|nr:FmdB family transcriptional regulator [Thermoleophilia bacterium]
MPTYEYRCVSCNHQFERFQRMSDEPVKECEICGAPVRRLLFPVAIQFKGNGFYTTDYARRSALAAAGSSGNGNGNGSGDSSAGEKASSESKKTADTTAAGASSGSDSGSSAASSN